MTPAMHMDSEHESTGCAHWNHLLLLGHALWGTAVVCFSAWAQKGVAEWSAATGGLWMYDFTGMWVLSAFVFAVFAVCFKAPTKRQLAGLLANTVLVCILSLAMYWADPNQSWDEYFRLTDRDALASDAAQLDCGGERDGSPYVTLHGPWAIDVSTLVMHEVVDEQMSLLFTADVRCGGEFVVVGCPMEWGVSGAVKSGAQSALSAVGRECGWTADAIGGANASLPLRALKVSSSFPSLRAEPRSIVPNVTLSTVYQWNAPSLEEARTLTSEMDRKHDTHPLLFSLVYAGLSTLVVLAVLLVPEVAICRRHSAGGGGGYDADGVHLLVIEADEDAEEVTIPL